MQPDRKLCEERFGATTITFDGKTEQRDHFNAKEFAAYLIERRTNKKLTEREFRQRRVESAVAKD